MPRASNGDTMRMHIENIPSLHSTVVLGIATAHGACHDKKTSTTSLLLPCLSRGTQHHAEQEINEMIDGKGSELFYNIKRDYSIMGLWCLESEARNSIELLCELISEPLLKEETLAAEQNNLVQKAREYLDNPITRQYIYNITKTIFGDEHPLGSPVVGYPDDIKAIKREDLLNTLQSSLMTEPIGIIIGNLDKHTGEELSNAFQSALENIPHNINKSRSYFSSVKQKNFNLFMNQDENSKNAYLSLNCLVLPQNKNYNMLKLVSAVLGSSFASRLFRIIRDEQGLSYMATNYYESVDKYSFFSNIIDIDSNKISKGITSLTEITTDLAENILSPEEFQITKDYLLGKLDLDFDNPTRLMNMLVPSLYHDGPTNLQGFYDGIKEIQREDILKWCENVIAKENLSLTVDGNFDANLVQDAWNKLSL